MQDLNKIENEHLQANDMGGGGEVYYKRSVDGEDVANALNVLESALNQKNNFAISGAVNALWELITEEA